MTSSMHVYGNMRPPGSMIERVPVGRTAHARSITLVPMAWPAPRISTWVDLPAPSPWSAPDPELLLSITIAPLRFTPVNWAPPTIVTPPWGPPVQSSTVSSITTIVDVSRRTSRRRRPFALAMMGVLVAAAGTVAAIIVNL